MVTVALLELYDRQLRTHAEVAECDEVTRIGPLFLATFPERQRGFITYDSLDGIHARDLDALIESAIAHFAADPRVTHVEWKTRGHDRPEDLLDRLVRHGLTVQATETVMIGEAAPLAASGPELPSGYRLNRAATEAAVREADALAGRVFGEEERASAARGDELVRRWHDHPESFEIWAVCNASGRVVCSGRVEFPENCDVAGLWGGACEAAERGQGLYRALTAARARSAIARGRLYLHSDCTEDSQPILGRLGLEQVTTTTPALWKR